MSFLTTTPTYDSVYQLESADDVQGGPGQISNWQAQALGNRDDFLKTIMAFTRFLQFTVTSGGGGWPGIINPSDSGRLFIMMPGSISAFQTLPLLSACPDNTVFGFLLPPSAYSAQNIISASGGDNIFNRELGGMVSSVNQTEGLVIVRKYPGSVAWDIVNLGREAGVGSIVGHQSSVGWPSTNMSAGWLPCNGVGYSTTSYPALFARIGYAFGGSGSIFNMPTLGPVGGGVYFFIHI